MIKPARRNHYPQILKLEKENNSIPDEDFQAECMLSGVWPNRETFDLQISDMGAVAIVATLPETTEAVKGYAVYSFDKKKRNIEIIKLEGDEASYYEIIKHLEGVSHKFGYRNIVMRSHEARTGQHNLLHSVGGIARKTIKNAFDNDDAYLFEWAVI